MMVNSTLIEIKFGTLEYDIFLLIEIFYKWPEKPREFLSSPDCSRISAANGGCRGSLHS